MWFVYPAYLALMLVGACRADHEDAIRRILSRNGRSDHGFPYNHGTPGGWESRNGVESYGWDSRRPLNGPTSSLPPSAPGASPGPAAAPVPVDAASGLGPRPCARCSGAGANDGYRGNGYDNLSPEWQERQKQKEWMAQGGKGNTWQGSVRPLPGSWDSKYEAPTGPRAPGYAPARPGGQGYGTGGPGGPGYGPGGPGGAGGWEDERRPGPGVPVSNWVSTPSRWDTYERREDHQSSAPGRPSGYPPSAGGYGSGCKRCQNAGAGGYDPYGVQPGGPPGAPDSSRWDTSGGGGIPTKPTPGGGRVGEWQEPGYGPGAGSWSRPPGDGYRPGAGGVGSWSAAEPPYRPGGGAGGYRPEDPWSTPGGVPGGTGGPSGPSGWDRPTGGRPNDIYRPGGDSYGRPVGSFRPGDERWDQPSMPGGGYQPGWNDKPEYVPPCNSCGGYRPAGGSAYDEAYKPGPPYGYAPPGGYPAGPNGYPSSPGYPASGGYDRPASQGYNTQGGHRGSNRPPGSQDSSYRPVGGYEAHDNHSSHGSDQGNSSKDFQRYPGHTGVGATYDFNSSGDTSRRGEGGIYYYDRPTSSTPSTASTTIRPTISSTDQTTTR